MAKFTSEILEIMLLIKGKVLNIWYRLRVVPIFLPPHRVSPFSRGVIFTRARVLLAFRSLYYP